MIRSGEQHTVAWATNFTPVSLHRFKDGVTDKVFSDPTITSENIYEAGVFKYRAWYGTGDDEYVDSDEFKVTKIYRVTLDPNGGTVSPTSMETNADGRLESLPTPTRDQYDFKAWYDAGAGVTVDADHVYAVSTTLVALWERKTYTVTFNANGGEVTPKSMTTGKDGKLSSLPTPTLEGRDFLYWTDATTGKQVGLDRVYTGNATLIAKWEKKTYAVSFDTKGGTAIDSQSVKYREKAERPAGVPKKDGWLFVDWYKDEACTTKFNFNSPITKNTTVYAKWVEGYFVDFYAEGGTPGFISVDVLKGHAVSRPIDPTKALHVFGGWYENLNNNEAFDFGTPITSHVTLYAKWLPQVVYDAGGHGENVTRTLNPGDLAEELRPRDEGYRFIGWYLDADGSVPFDFTMPVCEGVTLYAAWASEIESVSLGFEELKVGSYFGLDNNNYARLVLGKKDSEHYALPSKTVSWQKDGTEETVNNSQVVEGHPYAASFTLRANPGYVFPELATDAQKAAFLSMEGEFAGLVVTYPENGAMTGDAYLDLELNEDEDPRIAHTELTVTVTYVPRVLTINRVSFGFREPLAGQAFNPNGYNAIECAVDENAPFGVTVYQGGWKPEGGQNGETTFVKGRTYVGTLLLTAKPGFQFRRTSGNQDWEQYVQITRIYGGQILPCGAWAVNPIRFEVVRQWTEYGNSNVILEIYYVVEQRDLEMIINVTHDDDALEVIYAVDDEGTYRKAADRLCNDLDYVNAFESDRSSIQCKWYADGKLYATTTYNAGQGKRHEVRFGPEDAGKSLYVVMTYGQKSLTSETMTIDGLDVRTVKFVLNERCTGSAPETRYVKTGEKVERPADPQAAAGWKFAGWAPNATQGGLYDFDAAVTENLALYARVIKLVSVTFQANGGSGSMEVVTVGQGEQLELPACGFTAPEGLEFDCWRIGSVNYPAGARITISEDRYVKAVWKEAQVSVTDENLKIAKKSLTLYDTIAIEFKVEKAAVDASYRDPYLEVTQNGVGSKLSDYSISADGAYYVFTVRIAPHQLGDAVTAVPHALNANGEDVTGAEFTYSVAEYCYNMLNKEAYQGAEYAKLRRLLVDILLYGDAAQAYANYKTDALAGSNLTDAQRAMGTDVSVPMNYRSVKEPSYEAAEAGNALASIERAALYLEAAVNVQFKFTANDLSNLRVVITDNEACTNVMEEYEASAGLIDGNGLHYVNVSCLNAGQMRKTIYATVMKGSRKVSNTYRYSIESYASAMKGKGGDKLDNLLDAMMRYGDSAAAYVNNQ
ncbi:MAG: InlB B-repeat-containing protein [Acetatifactor sp.]|nr:InlB B-repeat-containing protein [Acetatifactor sp.]